MEPAPALALENCDNAQSMPPDLARVSRRRAIVQQRFVDRDAEFLFSPDAWGTLETAPVAWRRAGRSAATIWGPGPAAVPVSAAARSQASSMLSRLGRVADGSCETMILGSHRRRRGAPRCIAGVTQVTGYARLDRGATVAVVGACRLQKAPVGTSVSRQWRCGCRYNLRN
jgi:hypothetical protein